MRTDILEVSLRGLRGIQRRRIAGLGIGPSLTMPMIPGGGSSVARDADRRAVYSVAPLRATLPGSAVLDYGIAPIGEVGTSEPRPAFVPTMTFNPEGGASGDPLGAGREIEDAADAADVDRAGSGGDVVVPGPPPAPIERRSATEGLLGRYKWWILSFLVLTAGTGGWLAWRSVRRRR